VSLFGFNFTIVFGIAKGGSPLPGFGVSPKNLFFSFYSPPQAASPHAIEAKSNDIPLKPSYPN
jgi:hypothetical protein